MTASTSVSIFDRIFGGVFKQPIPESIVNFHRRVYRDLSKQAWHIQRIYSEKFDNDEFVRFLQIRRDINCDQGEYKGLQKSIELLEIVLETKDSFLLISETEMRFRSKTQQTFYTFVDELLRRKYSHLKTVKLLRTALQRVITKLKTKEGKMVMQSYVQALEKIIRHPLGARLLTSFKHDDLHVYTMLKELSYDIKTLKKQESHNMKGLTILIYDKQESFRYLGKLIELPKPYQRPSSYAKMLRYLSLKHRHKKSNLEFDSMMDYLAKWEKEFITLMEIRSEYSAKKYRQIKEFSQGIPALDIYRKYKSYLEEYLACRF